MGLTKVQSPSCGSPPAVGFLLLRSKGRASCGRCKTPNPLAELGGDSSPRELPRAPTAAGTSSRGHSPVPRARRGRFSRAQWATQAPRNTSRVTPCYCVTDGAFLDVNGKRPGPRQKVTHFDLEALTQQGAHVFLKSGPTPRLDCLCAANVVHPTPFGVLDPPGAA